jgi:hypothetical protein
MARGPIDPDSGSGVVKLHAPVPSRGNDDRQEPGCWFTRRRPWVSLALDAGYYRIFPRDDR